MYLKEKLSEVCSRHSERVLDTPHNPISLGGNTLNHLPRYNNSLCKGESLGTRLLNHCMTE